MQHHIVQRVIPTNQLPIPPKLSLQHHPAGQTILAPRSLQDLSDLLRLHIGHKALGAQVDPQQRHSAIPQATHNGEDGAVPADHDRKGARAGKLLQAPERKILRKSLRLILGKDGTDHSFKARLFQHTAALAGQLQLQVTKRIRANSDHRNASFITPRARPLQLRPDQAQPQDILRFSASRCIQCFLPAL